MDNALREEIIVSAGLFPLAGLQYSPLQQNQPQLPFLFPYDFFDLRKKERTSLSIP